MTMVDQDTTTERRRLERSRRMARLGLGLLALAALFWLAALTKPGNAGGVVILEAMTAVLAVVLVRRAATLTRRLAALQRADSAGSRRDAIHDPITTRVAPPDLRFDPARTPQLTLRPRPLPALAGMAGAVGAVAGLLWLDYRAAFFDPRTLVFALYAAIATGVIIRARVVLIDGVMWQRRFNRYRPVSLDHLAHVEFTRARYSKREGLLPIGVLRVIDIYGRQTALKPALWSGGGRQLLATIKVAAQAQALVLDDTTTNRLAARVPDFTPDIPSWAYNTARSTAPAAASVRPTRTARPQLLIPVIAVIALLVPAMIVLGRAGTAAIRSARCSSSRALWSNAPDFPSGDSAVLSMAQRLAPAVVSGRTGAIYRLAPADLANRHNTLAVQRDAQQLADGAVVDWSQGNTSVAEVQIERFGSHADALAFQRDYDEDHCHTGDQVFSTPTVPGGVGLRCNCTGSNVSDRIAFVRGATRFQVIEWSVPRRQGHDKATMLAQRALDAARL